MLFPFVHKELPVAVLKLRDYMEQKVCAHMKKTEDKNSSKKAVKRNPYRDEAIKNKTHASVGEYLIKNSALSIKIVKHYEFRLMAESSSP